MKSINPVVNHYLEKEKHPIKITCLQERLNAHLMDQLTGCAQEVKKKIDMIAANNLKQEGAGFGTDTNIITLITREETKELELMTKEEAANAILDEILSKMK